MQDSRLVVLNAMDAARRGADVFTRTACVNMEPQDGHWTLRLRDTDRGAERSINAKMVVNAAGPWVSGVLEESALDAPDVPQIRLVKGSHIIVKKMFEGDHAYILQQPDKRIVFAIPYEGDYTLIGTTEEDYQGAPAEAKISPAEIEYLCAAFNRSFDEQITEDNILWSYSGVRPLFDDGEDAATSTTRDYVLHEHKEYDAPLLSVFGGKLTTYRVLAEQVLDKLVGREGRWSAGAALPGGDIDGGDFEIGVYLFGGAINFGVQINKEPHKVFYTETVTPIPERRDAYLSKNIRWTVKRIIEKVRNELLIKI